MVCDELSAVQLRDGGIEIAPPPQGNSGGKEDGAASIILQVFNEHAEKVEIEYQPASRQGDTRWGFWCDGQILKAVIPYEFWKSYWCPELYTASDVNHEEQLQLNNAVKRLETRKSSTEPVICNSSRGGAPVSEQSPSSVLIAGIKICQCRDQNEDALKTQESSRQVSISFQPSQAEDMIQAESNLGSSDRTRVIKVKCRGPPGSQEIPEHFERAIKVRCSRPVSPIQLFEQVGKMRYSTPTSPLPAVGVAGTPSSCSSRSSNGSGSGSQHSIDPDPSDRTVESASSTPTSAEEALAKAKEALARVQRMSEGSPSPHTRPPAAAAASSSDCSSERLSESRCVTPRLPAEEALARARDALSRAHSRRPSLRPAPAPAPAPAPVSPPSTPKTSAKPSSRSVANTEVYVRCASTDLSPLQVCKISLESGVSSDTSDLRSMKSFSGDTSDLVNMTSRGTSFLQTGRPFNTVVVGRIILRESLKQENRPHWKTAVGNFISQEKANFLKHGKKSKEIFRDTVEFLSKETYAFLSEGKRYIATKKQKWGLANLECIFCLRFAPSSVNPDGIMNWTSFNDTQNWERENNMTANGNKKCRLLVTTGTNTVTCSSTNA